MLEVDELRARKDSQLGELYLHGKLLYAAVIEKHHDAQPLCLRSDQYGCAT